MLEQGECTPYINAWNNWFGGVVGSIVVHNESDPAADTWELSLKFDQVTKIKINCGKGPTYF